VKLLRPALDGPLTKPTRLGREAPPVASPSQTPERGRRHLGLDSKTLRRVSAVVQIFTDPQRLPPPARTSAAHAVHAVRTSVDASRVTITVAFAVNVAAVPGETSSF